MSSHDAWIWGVVAGEWLGIVAMAHFIRVDRPATLKVLFLAYSVAAAVVMFGGAAILKVLGQ